jgi:hypothetical protein
LHPIRHIIGIGGANRRGRGVPNIRWSSFVGGGDLLVHLLFFIRVAEDNDITVAKWPKKFTVEFTEESSSELGLTRDLMEDFLLIERKIHHKDRLRRTIVLTN